MKRIKILTGVSPLRAYSGIKYLATALHQENLDVELIAKIPRKDIEETKNWNINIRSFYSKWYGRIPLFRRYMTHLDFFLTSIFKADIIIFHELTFYRSVILLKKLFPNKTFIHYCTELYTEEDVPEHKKLLDIYKKNANVPDLIIEVDSGREKLRKKMYNISTPTVVIPNTIPKSEVKIVSDRKCLIDIIGEENYSSEIPIIVYTGGAFLHRQLDIIVDAISALKKKVIFVGFVYGEEKGISKLIAECEKKLTNHIYKIIESIPRDDLLKCIGSADAGIVYYKPSLSIGNLYAAPTKLFEYIGLGIPVISSNNPQIVKMINKYGLGECVEDETTAALTKAISKIVYDKNRITNIKSNEKKYFESHLCYEKSAKDAIDIIVEMASEVSMR